MVKNRTLLSLLQLEAREVPTAGLVRVAPVDPFAGVTADHVGDQPGVAYADTQVEPHVVANPTRANNGPTRRSTCICRPVRMSV